jgi:hypothetical protein
MSGVRTTVLRSLDLGDPWRESAGPDRTLDLQGWRSDHPFLVEAVAQMPSAVVVEVGVWKGGSTIAMAKELERRWGDGVVISVDTFLGSSEHYRNPEWKASLQIEGGYPTLYRTFASNVVHEGLTGYVVPLPLDSVNAAHLLHQSGVVADVVHVDAGHDYQSVSTDLSLWFGILKPGGIMVCDDYSSEWPEVIQAVDEFTSSATVGDIRVSGGKIWFTKSVASDRITEGSAASSAPSASDAQRMEQAVRQRNAALERVEFLEREHEAVLKSRIWRWTAWLHG